MLLDDRFFFHTFPRPKRNEAPEATLNRAINILVFMKDTGLVLAPEIVTWQIEVAGGVIDRLEVLQQRACFTELAVNELERHAATFGPITLSFDIDQLRGVGLTPVIYVPQHVGLGSLSQIGTICAKAAWHTRYVLQRLQDLKVLSDPDTGVARWGHPLAPDATFNLTNTDPAGNVIANYTVPAAQINAIMKHIGYRSIPFDHSIAMLNVFLNMFYPTDNSHSGELLGYYRQREWRLIGGGIDFNGRPIARNLTLAEAERLVAIDPKFWSDEIVVDGKRQPRSTLARIYDPVADWNFFDLVRKVFTPRTILERVRAIAGNKAVAI